MTDIVWICPRHGSVLTFTDLWTCPSGCDFPIVDVVSRFVPVDSYSSSFGVQWNHWPRTQLDSHSGVPVSRDRMWATLGDELFGRLEGATVLEVGAGAGRFTEVLLAEGATVYSVDLSTAIDANARNCPPSTSHVLAQADATNLPFASGQFDIVLALGMVQHTPRPEKTMRHLATHVAPGGWIVIDHYPKGLVHRVRAAQAYRAVMKRMPPEKALARTMRMHEFWSPIHARTRSTPGRKALVIMSPIVYFGDGWPQLTVEQRREWGVLDTYDSLTDHYKHRRSPQQVRALFDTLPLDDVWVGMAGPVVVAKGQAR